MTAVMAVGLFTACGNKENTQDPGVTATATPDASGTNNEGTQTPVANRVVLKDLDVDIAGKNVLIVEDIIDSGLTLSNLVKELQIRNPKSLKLCTLLDKPERRKADVQVDYVGFVIEDKFIVGYGIDWAEKYRNLPYIGAVTV